MKIPNNQQQESDSIENKNCKYCGKPFEITRYSNGKLAPICDCYFDMENKKEIAINKKELIRRIIRTSGIGKRYAGKNFSNYNTKNNPKAVKDCKDYVLKFKQNKKDGRGLFLTGKVGTGKTHLLAGIIDGIARIHQCSVFYRSATELLNEIRATIKTDDNENKLQKLKDCELLIIDDIGTEKTSEWVMDIYFSIIDFRYSNLKPIVIATNLTDSEVKDKFNERIMSRIFEMCDGVKLTGNDFRMTGGNTK